MRIKFQMSYLIKIVPDILCGILLGFFILHPVAMLITGSSFYEHGEGHFSSKFIYFFLSPMSIYFTLLGMCIGLLSGVFRSVLRVQNVQLNERITERNSLLRILSHDLNNSVGAASGYVRLLGYKEVPFSKSREFMCIATSLKQAIALMETAKNIIALQSGKLTLAIDKSDMIALVKDVLLLFEFKCSSRGIVIDLKIPSDETCFAYVDPVIFQNSILGNILSNAVKFSKSNESIEIVIFNESSKVIVSVTNTGPEIPVKKIENLFQEGENISSAGVTGERGTGFGLPLAYTFTKMMGGEIWAECVRTERKDLYRNTFTVQISAA